MAVISSETSLRFSAPNFSFRRFLMLTTFFLVMFAALPAPGLRASQNAIQQNDTGQSTAVQSVRTEAAKPKPQLDAPPNVVFILCDDLG